MGQGSSATLECREAINNDIDGNGVHEMRQFSLILKYRAEGAALQIIN